LVDLINEAGKFYSLTKEEIDRQKRKLEDEMYTLVALNKKSTYFWCSRLLMSSKEAVKSFWEKRLSGEVLPLTNNPIKVERRDVFHAPEMKDGSRDEGTVLPYNEMFEADVTGVASAGKTTLVKNIALQLFNPQQGDADYLRSFNLLIFFECRMEQLKI
jgi:hypothetical protein